MKYVFMVVLTTISFSNYAMASDDSWYWGFSIGTRIDGGVISDANQEIDQFHSNFGGSLVYGPISEVSLFYPFKNINALVGLSSGGLNQHFKSADGNNKLIVGHRNAGISSLFFLSEIGKGAFGRIDLGTASIGIESSPGEVRDYYGTGGVLGMGYALEFGSLNLLSGIEYRYGNTTFDKFGFTALNFSFLF